MINTPSFLSSLSGRLLLATSGLNAIAIGVLALIGPSPIHLYVVGVVPMVSIILCLWCVAFAVERDDGAPVFLELALPFAAGISYAALSVAPRAGLLFGVAFAAMGAIALLIALYRLLDPVKAQNVDTPVDERLELG